VTKLRLSERKCWWAMDTIYNKIIICGSATASMVTRA
jgi:hypothetical protein